MSAPARPVDKESLEHYLTASSHSPTAMRLVLGNLLRRMRKQSGIEAEAAGRHIGGSEAKISRLERGHVTCKEPDVMDLLALYGVRDEQVLACFAQMVDLSRRSGWWQRYDGVLPDWFGKLIGLQEAASVIRTYEVQLVPGLLQTADYARAARRGHPRPGPTATAGHRGTRPAPPARPWRQRLVAHRRGHRPVAAPGSSHHSSAHPWRRAPHCPRSARGLGPSRHRHHRCLAVSTPLVFGTPRRRVTSSQARPRCWPSPSTTGARPTRNSPIELLSHTRP